MPHDYQKMMLEQLRDDLWPYDELGTEKGGTHSEVTRWLGVAWDRMKDLTDGHGDLDAADIALEHAADAIARCRRRLGDWSEAAMDDYLETHDAPAACDETAP